MLRKTGTYDRSSASGEEVSAFVPYPLPPKDPPLDEKADRLRRPLASAVEALKRLELAGRMVPSVGWFIYSLVRKEAVVSSQIEGTQATLVDLLSFEASGESTTSGADVEEVCNYLDALEYAGGQLRDERGLPLSMRLLNEAHRRLMYGVRGADKHPGAIRRSQNWIGGTRPGNAVYVPPPPQRLAPLLSDFEKYIHIEYGPHPLVRTGLLHVQFETIHPYLDGNGRIGRLLISLLLEHWNILSQPLLYLSLHFKRHRAEYYRLLNAVRREGDWEAWLVFFLGGVSSIADEAVVLARDAFLLVEQDRTRLLGLDGTSVAALRLFELLLKNPIISIAFVVDRLGVSAPTAARAVEALVRAGVLAETTGKRRDRAWAYTAYLDQLRVGTELAAHPGRP